MKAKCGVVLIGATMFDIKILNLPTTVSFREGKLGVGEQVGKGEMMSIWKCPAMLIPRGLTWPR